MGKYVESFNEFLNEQLNENYVKDITFAKRSKNFDELRLIAGSISGEYSKWKEAEDKEVTKYVNAYVKRQREAKKFTKVNSDITKELERILKSDGLHIHAHARTPDHLKIQFVSPMFYGSDDLKVLKDNLAFLKKSDTLRIDAQPSSRGRSVTYSGTIENDRGDIIKFEDINNGLAVQMG